MDSAYSAAQESENLHSSISYQITEPSVMSNGTGTVVESLRLESEMRY